ncbi:MAG: hypothetical protein ACF8PN_08370 [Phycisphaerales bacterium]
MSAKTASTNSFYLRLGAAALLGAGVATWPAAANETDQFTLPAEVQFVDIGDYLSLVHYQVLKDTVEHLNERIRWTRSARTEDTRQETLAEYHDPMEVADQVRVRFGPGFIETLRLEEALHSGKARRRYSDQALAYRTGDWIYTYTHLPIDPRKLVLAVQSSTIYAYGVYLGTDKVAHFHDLGHYYFRDYQKHLASGMNSKQARRRVVDEYSNGIISEKSIIGNIATGVHSNADLAANYLGFKFYENLTEPVMLQGEERPPMLVRIGDYWALNHHVRPDTDFFRPFISDHMNEALNPCVYEAGMRSPIRKRIEKMSADILYRYADDDGEPREPEWFDARAEELVTYFGEDYGHTGIVDEMVLLSEACFSDRAVELAAERRLEWGPELNPNADIRAGVRGP